MGEKDSFPAEDGHIESILIGVLSIEAEKMEIFQVGIGAEMNSAIFDVGYEYIGGQEFPYYDNG